jgi:hypothetical protein
MENGSIFDFYIDEIGLVKAKWNPSAKEATGRNDPMICSTATIYVRALMSLSFEEVQTAIFREIASAVGRRIHHSHKGILPAS